jgi:hypothetical protein
MLCYDVVGKFRDNAIDGAIMDVVNVHVVVCTLSQEVISKRECMLGEMNSLAITMAPCLKSRTPQAYWKYSWLNCVNIAYHSSGLI